MGFAEIVLNTLKKHTAKERIPLENVGFVEHWPTSFSVYQLIAVFMLLGVEHHNTPFR